MSTNLPKTEPKPSTQRVQGGGTACYLNISQCSDETDISIQVSSCGSESTQPARLLYTCDWHDLLLGVKLGLDGRHFEYILRGIF
jgi:hypothetical protein